MSRQHKDQVWVYGNVLYDPANDDSQHDTIVQPAATSGWLPKDILKDATAADMQKLAGLIGDGGMEDLKEPWPSDQIVDQTNPGAIFLALGSTSAMGDVQIVEVAGEERKAVTDAFMHTLQGRGISVNVCRSLGLVASNTIRLFCGLTVRAVICAESGTDTKFTDVAGTARSDVAIIISAQTQCTKLLTRQSYAMKRRTVGMRLADLSQRVHNHGELVRPLAAQAAVALR